jgi:hypothetical protein
MQELKSTGQISKIYFSFWGGDSVIDFTTLNSSIMVDGKTPKSSSLYKNFMALWEVFAGVVDGMKGKCRS